MIYPKITTGYHREVNIEEDDCDMTHYLFSTYILLYEDKYVSFIERGKIESSTSISYIVKLFGNFYLKAREVYYTKTLPKVNNSEEVFQIFTLEQILKKLTNED